MNTLSQALCKFMTSVLMSFLAITSDDCDKFAIVSIDRVRQVSPESRSGAHGDPEIED